MWDSREEATIGYGMMSGKSTEDNSCGLPFTLRIHQGLDVGKIFVAGLVTFHEGHGVQALTVGRQEGAQCKTILLLCNWKIIHNLVSNSAATTRF